MDSYDMKERLKNHIEGDWTTEDIQGLVFALAKDPNLYRSLIQHVRAQREEFNRVEDRRQCKRI